MNAKILLGLAALSSLFFFGKKKPPDAEDEDSGGRMPGAGPGGLADEEEQLFGAKPARMMDRPPVPAKRIPFGAKVNVPKLAELICNGGPGSTPIMAIETSQVDMVPDKIDSSWGLFQRCVAYLEDGTLGFDAGYYFVLTRNASYSFGPYSSLENMAPWVRYFLERPYTVAKKEAL